ncbi:non-ribosomal peptide synthetase modules and related proteins [Candidatus Scalindua japonica]|uniref:Non-ribosomal peptide synthetase modules and related proteins n=1 Tax=Candidatus Scalindua japonica TaxID=1284222 RepID=A0A286U279_9BACT|nr:acyl carrier protein [Candidatus Scalindua japonica]GAX62225.1 non-ribosomal peptide synthetase modules and related proteins [Candidatus Scalindua japonica]
MDKSEICDKIYRVLREVNPNLEQSKISEEASFFDYDIDSLKLIELGLRIESEFDQELNLDDWVDWESQKENSAFSISSFIEYVQNTVDREK